jgi:hypothetical protein
MMVRLGVAVLRAALGQVKGRSVVLADGGVRHDGRGEWLRGRERFNRVPDGARFGREEIGKVRRERGRLQAVVITVE